MPRTLTLELPSDAPMFDLAAAERCLVNYALAATDGNQKNAAKLLGVSPRVINYKMKILGIPRANGPRRGPRGPYKKREAMVKQG